MTTSTLSAGVTSSGITVANGGTWDIYGTADGFKAPDLAHIYVFAGGVTNSTTLGFIGTEVVSTGGSALSTTISSGGAQGETGGGVAIDTIVKSAGFEDVLAGGVTSFTTVSAMGTGFVSSGGVASDSTVSDGGFEVVLASGTTVSAAIVSGGQEFVSSGGVASATLVELYGSQIVLAGGSAVSTTVFGNPALDAGGGGEELVSAGGLAIGTTVSSGGTEVIDAGGSATGIDVVQSGVEQVTAGAVVSDTVLLGGGVIDIPYLSYSTSGTVSFDPATSVVTATVGSATYSQTLSGTYTPAHFSLRTDNGTGTEIYYAPTSVVSAGVTSSGLVVEDEFWDIYGTAQSFSVAGINAFDTVITVFAGGVESGSRFLRGDEIVSSGGTASSTRLDVGTMTVLSDGRTFNVSGGEEIISAGGTATDTHLSIDSYEVISSGGTAISTQINAGGTELISSGGTERFATISYNNAGPFGHGKQIVYSGGTASDTTVTSKADEYVSKGGTTSDTTLSSGGIEVVSSGGSATGTTVSSGGVETISNGGSATGTTVGSGGIEVISSGGSATGTDLLPSGTIDVAFLPGGSALYDSSTRVLSVTSGTTSYTQTLTGSYAGLKFETAPDSGGTGTDVTVACYCAGTLIRTDRGDRPIEQLAIGDRVVTRSGPPRPIKWIGRRSYDGRFIRNNPDVLPIRIEANALGDGLPRRALHVSPQHALWFASDAAAGVLVPVGHLVNGVSILPAAPVDRIDYLHVELASHDVILAESLPAETFVDCDSRRMFHNAAEFAALYPGEEPPRWAYCAPRLDDAAALEPLWRRLAARAGVVAAAGPLQGHLDGAGAGIVRGWARDQAAPDIPVVIEIVVGGAVLGRVAANQYRGDLVKAGYGHGRYGFRFRLPAWLAPTPPHLIGPPHLLVVRRAADGALLARETTLLPPSVASQARGAA